MSDEREAPPPGVEVIPDDVAEEMDRIEAKAQKRLIQKIMDDRDFGQRLIDNPEETLSDPGLAEDLGIKEEVEAHSHRRWETKWRYKCYYTAWRGWAHLQWRRRSGWVWVF